MKKEIKENKGTLFNKHNFAIHNFCDTSSTKPALGGIFVSPAHTVATNGFTMIKVDTPKEYSLDDFPMIPNKPKPLENFKSFILNRKPAIKILGLFQKSDSLPILENAVLISNKEKTVEIGTTDLESFSSITSQKIEDKFPEYNQLFVEKGKHIEICVNPKLLKKILDFYINFMDEPLKGLKIKIPIKNLANSFNIDNTPIRFNNKKKNGQEANALLMPIKEEN